MGVSYSGLTEVRSRVDLKRYSGLWYEIARSRGIPFEPPGTTDVTAEYVVDKSTGALSITNRALANGRPVSWSTRVVRVDGPYNARLVLEGPRAPMYRILELDFENYQWAVVAGSESSLWVWILSREPRMDRKLYLRLTSLLEDQHGFDPRTLEITPHVLQHARNPSTVNHHDADRPPHVVFAADGSTAVVSRRAVAQGGSVQRGALTSDE